MFKTVNLHLIKVFRRMISYFELFNVYIDFRRKRIDRLHFDIYKLWFSEKTPFQLNKSLFYQTHPELRIQGIRPTIARVSTYGLLRELNTTSRVLDIGGNTGFFSLYLAKHVQHVDMVEFNKTFSHIAELVKDYLGITNYSIFNEDIKKYKPRNKYDLIISNAIHKWVELPIDEYYKLISNWLVPSGLILFESHASEEDITMLDLFFNTYSDLNIEKSLIDDQLGAIRAFYLIRKKESRE